MLFQLCNLCAYSYRYPFTSNQSISPIDWEEYISEIASDIMKEQSLKWLFQVRLKLYELLVNCIPPETILKENRMRLGQKEIFHLEAFLAKFMCI
nr:replication factor C subunit 3-like [Ziziphus jujuba var. spinosa]